MDKFLKSYLETALWTETDDNDIPLDDYYSIEDFAPEAIKVAEGDCKDFQELCAKDLAQAGEEEAGGHDFWLTRNGHGTGFWDRSYGEVGERLSREARNFGSTNVYVGDNGKLYFS